MNWEERKAAYTAKAKTLSDVPKDLKWMSKFNTLKMAIMEKVEADIKSGKINKYKEIIAQKEGISNVKVETDFTNFILKIQCDFTSILTLQKAIKEIVIDESKTKKEIESYWLTWEGNKLIRSVPSITGDLTSRLKKEDIEGLKKGNYMSITRFDRPIEKCENTASLISANKMAVMLKITPYALIQNINLLENNIVLSDKK